jgi:two-component system sensor histidine kinase BaeS
MRSLALKLTLAFLVVGVVGVALVALFVGQRTQREFDQFVLDRYQLDLLDELAAYYQSNGSWEGINAILVRDQPGRMGHRGFYPAPVTLLDADRVVVYGGRRYQRGEQLTGRENQTGVPLEVEGETVGWLLFEAFGDTVPPLPESPESDFLDRVKQAILLGALGATAVALLIGVFLARTISRPVRELTAATQVVAQGALGHQVPVRTQDELGELAASFNQMSADLAQATELRRQMTADIAHELRTPLSVIMGYTEALSDGKLEGTPETFDVLHEEAQHLSRLVDDLRTLSLADAGELSLTCRPVPPQALLERAASAYAAQAQGQNVLLHVETEGDLPEVEVDPDRMAQVLGNLVSNALRYTPAGGKIVLSAEHRPGTGVARPGSLYIRVRDTGTGIAPEDLPHIFDRFYREDKSRHLQEGESGLGLAIARSLVEAHGGNISAESTLGAGTTFTIQLPARDF